MAKGAEQIASRPGRVAIVTGGTRGIGAAISLRLAADGATVAAVYNTNRQAAEQFAEGRSPMIFQSRCTRPTSPIPATAREWPTRSFTSTAESTI
jgi:NAD(P)-dependent dehydrogenase (short-subunit alcohol dehydrogenase family)